MTALMARVRRLEQATSDDGLCPHGLRVEYPPEDKREPSGPKICLICNRPRVALRDVREGPRPDCA
jgi:hypothetical protein